MSAEDAPLTDDPIPPASPLRWRSNPRSSLDYVVALDGVAPGAGCRIRLRYVPDKLILDKDSFIAHLATLAPDPDASADAGPETMALALLDEINNEIVPRWVQIALSAEQGGAPIEMVILTDRQPNWDNPEILESLPPL